MDAKTLAEIGQDLFAKRGSLMMLWQEQGENFYPERADFTYRRSLGTDFASNLMTSYPLLCRRDLGDQIGTMLRPTAKPWFEMKTLDEGRMNNDARRWLQEKTGIQRRAMYDRKSLFTKAMKEGDHDYAAFGQTVPSVRLNRNRDTLLYQTWHLRDVAWKENEDGQVCGVWRKWKPGARELKRMFGDRIHRDVEQLLTQNKPFEETECMHMVVEMDLYDGEMDRYDWEAGKSAPRKVSARDRERFPYVSIYYDVAHDHVMEAMGVFNKEYIVSRWQTVSGSQYAFSPATIAALPDARLIQAMTYTLLEAGEKVVNPPIIATEDVVRSDVAIYAGGLTWIDRDYDEKLGAALRTMPIDAKGMPLGIEMMKDSRSMIMQAFYLSKLNLPQRSAEMTAYEVGQRIQEYIRGALPLFEPMEDERNGQVCDVTFELLFRAGAFGSPQDMPASLQGAEIQFGFMSPLHDAIEELKGQKFLQMGSYIAAAVQLDPSAAAIPDVKVALRDALQAVGTPATWMRSEVTVKQIEDQAQAAQKAQATLAAMQQGSEVVGNLAGAAKDQAAATAVPA